MIGLHTFAYDARSRRVFRSTPGGDATVVFSGGTSVQEYFLPLAAGSSSDSGAEEEAGSGSSSTAAWTGPDVEYIRGSDYGGGIGGILHTVRGGAASCQHYNHRGDVIARSAATPAATVTWTAAYQAFGTRPDERGTNPDPHRANTKEEDTTGLLNEGHRYRCLETGMFITRDPAGFVDGPNLYAYVRQNPWTNFDPEGLAERYIIMGGTSVGDPEHDRSPFNFSTAMVNTLKSLSKQERKKTEVLIYGPAYRERASLDACAQYGEKGITKLTATTYLDNFKKEAEFLGSKVTVVESAKGVIEAMGKSAEKEIKKAVYFGHSGILFEGKVLALDYHSNGAPGFGDENITADKMATLKSKFAEGGKFEHRGCHGGFPGGFCQELSNLVPQIETEGALLRSNYANISNKAVPDLSKNIPDGSEKLNIVKNEWIRYQKGIRKN